MNTRQFKDRKRGQKHSLITHFIVIAALLAVAILVLLYGRIDLSGVLTAQNKTTDGEYGKAPNGEQQTADEYGKAPNGEQQTADEYGKAPNGGQQTADEYGKAPNGEQQTADEHSEAASEKQQTTLRQEYIARMNSYENEIKAQIEELNLAAWSPESSAVLQTQEQKALKAFAENQFATALRHLDALFSKVSELQLLQQQLFATALTDAQRAFAAGQTQQANSAIDDALRYFPEDRDALLLRKRIGTMAEIAELIKAADTAHIENDLDKESKLLNKAIELDPHRDELIERQRSVLQSLRQQKLDNLLLRASKALDNKRVKEAQALLSQIKRIDATHPSLAPLAKKAAQIQRELSYQNFVARAKSAAQNDDWQTAQSYYQQASGIFPDHKEIAEQLRRAAQINNYTKTIKQALEKPERLADEQIASAMKQLARDGSEVAKHSTQLQRLIRRLELALAEMSTPVAVTVYSDEQTYISVMGVGLIGKVKEYQLRDGLKPGRYLFKGERKGFKDKLVEIHIKPRQAAIVRVICDETI